MDKDKREPNRTGFASGVKLFKRLIPCSLQSHLCQKRFLLLGVSLLIAILVNPSFMIETPHYRLGQIADQNIKAKHDFLVEDEAATAKKREEAVEQSPLVYDYDPTVAKGILEKLNESFNAMRSAAGFQPVAMPPGQNPAGFTPNAAPRVPDSVDRTSKERRDFEKALGCPVGADIFRCLIQKQFSPDVENKIEGLLRTMMDRGIVSSKAWGAGEQNRDIVIRKVGTGKETLVQPPFPYMDINEARKMIVMQALEPGRDVRELMLISAIVSSLLKPDLSFNLIATQKKRAQAKAAVKPVFIKIARNEMLVREGQIIGPEEVLKLRHQFKKSSNIPWFVVLFATFTFCTITLGIVLHVVEKSLPYLRPDMRDYVFLGILLILLLMVARLGIWFGDNIGNNSSILSTSSFIYAVPLSAGAMIACIFFGVTSSIIFSLVVTLFSGIIFGKEFAMFFYFMIGAFVAAHSVSQCKNRMVPIKAGMLVGLANVVLIILCSFFQGQWVFLKVLGNCFFGLFGGVFAGILASGLTPLAEMLFGYTTDTKLLELATMDQPLLQDLMVEAPGTYHHSIIVGNMVEAAAKSIGANALLAKVAAYYHDIGKTKKPLYFIENQFQCENRHEKLAPSMSSLILISHVKDGVELARQHHLGKEIIDIISQHHGKSSISFFYNKAIEAREKTQSAKSVPLPPINADDYRYPGPKPQTKEAGLVLLADVVEAACRTLTEPTPARIQGMVNKLMNNIFSDGQLDECELTLKDIHQIAKHFNQILATIHHKRIEYPSTNNGKAKTDVQDPAREPKPDKDKTGAPKERGEPGLKRLGIH